MDEVNNDDNFTNALKVCGLINATPNGKDFGFSCCDVNYVINCNDLKLELRLQLRQSLEKV